MLEETEWSILDLYSRREEPERDVLPLEGVEPREEDSM